MRIEVKAKETEIAALNAKMELIQTATQQAGPEPAPAPAPEAKSSTLTAAEIIPVLAQAMAVVQQVVPPPKTSAPRMKRTAVRDENGLISHTIDEPIEEMEP